MTHIQLSLGGITPSTNQADGAHQRIFSLILEHALLTTNRGDIISIPGELCGFLDGLYDQRLGISWRPALRILAELGIVTISEESDTMSLIKVSERLQPITEGAEGSLSWQLARLQSLGHESTTPAEILRLQNLLTHLLAPEELGSHSFAHDPRNASVLVNVNGVVVPRAEAVVSALDRGVLLGDGIWESFRVEQRHVLFFDEHMERFDANVRQLNFPRRERSWYREQLIRTLIANKMESGVHVRFVVTRGDSITPFQSPRVAFGGPNLIIIPEYKPANVRKQGLHLILSPYRRSRSDMFSPEMHVTSKVPDILNMIHAEQYGADEPLMLDDLGNIKAGSSSCFFLVLGDTVTVPTSENLLQGITRQKIIEIIKNSGHLKLEERIVSVHDLYKAQEAFVTGTAGGVVPVKSVDTMQYGNDGVGPVVSYLQRRYQELLKAECERSDYSLS